MGNLNTNKVRSLYLHFALQTEVHGSENCTDYETYTVFVTLNRSIVLFSAYFIFKKCRNKVVGSIIQTGQKVCFKNAIGLVNFSYKNRRYQMFLCSYAFCVQINYIEMSLTSLFVWYAQESAFLCSLVFKVLKLSNSYSREHTYISIHYAESIVLVFSWNGSYTC